MPKRYAIIVGCMLALVVALYAGLFLAGIPALEQDAMEITLISSKISCSTFLGWIFSPRAESFCDDGMAVISSRMVQPFIFKLLYALFSDNPVPFLVYRLLIATFLLVGVYALFYMWSKDLLLASLASLFILANPGFGASIVEFWDTETLGQLFTVLALLCFIPLSESLFEKSGSCVRWKPFLAALCLFYFFGNLAVKSKDTEKLMMPCLIWGYLLLASQIKPRMTFAQWKGDRRLHMLFGACALITLPLVWVKRHTVYAPIEFHPMDMLKLLLWNTHGWEPESKSILFRLHRKLPGSVLDSFGFFLSWLGIFLIFPVLRRLKTMATEGTLGRPLRMILLMSLWMVFTLPICIVRPTLHLPRYLILALIPATLMFFYFVHLVFSGRPGKFWKVCKGLIVVLALVQILDNTRHSFYFRNALPAIWIKQYKVRTEVYKQMTGDTQVTPQEVHLYFKKLNYPIDRLDLLYPHERKDLFSDAQFNELVNRFQTVYLATTHPLPEHPGFTLVKVMDSLGDDPYSLVMKKFSPGGREKIYLFRVTKI